MDDHRLIEVDDREIEARLRKMMSKRDQLASCLYVGYPLNRMSDSQVAQLYEQMKDRIRLIPKPAYNLVSAQTPKTSGDLPDSTDDRSVTVKRPTTPQPDDNRARPTKTADTLGRQSSGGVEDVGPVRGGQATELAGPPKMG